MPEWPPRCATGPSISLSGAFSPESPGHHELPVGHLHVRRPLGLDGLGEGDRLFQIGHARNQHWRGCGSKRRNAYVPAHDALDPPPRRLARPSARRGDAGGLRGAHGPPVRPRRHHAQPGAAGDEGRRGRRLSRPNSQSGSGRARIRAADDLLPDRRGRSGRAGARQGRGRVGRGQALSRARHDQFGARRDLDGRDRPRPRGDGEGRHAAAGPWRGHRSRGRHLRPRGGVPRQGADAADRSATRA